MDKLISPIGEDWSADREAASAISTWERDTGLRLPDDYRGFVLRYDGGRPYPLTFRHTALEAEGFENPSEHYLDPLYSWDRVVSWSQELGNRLPAGCMSTGADPGLLEIVLSLRARIMVRSTAGFEIGVSGAARTTAIFAFKHRHFTPSSRRCSMTTTGTATITGTRRAESS